MDTEVLIIGAGLAGLSAGYHLGECDHIIVEAEKSIGGLCRSFLVDGFHFDCTGHLIHFRSQEGRRIIESVVGDRVKEHQRKAAIFLEGRFTDYPFQANTYGLPPEIIKECILGFVQTVTQKHKARIKNFYDWIHDTFGAGIARHFMIPYNEKLWQHDLRDIALDWVGWSIPKPSLEDVVNGALGIKNKQFGYNPVFYYPSEGGIDLLPNSLPVRGTLILDCPVIRVNLKKRRATLRDGHVIGFRYLFSTMPLHALLTILEDVPASLISTRERLQYVSVVNINIGIGRENVIPYHWIYFPEKDKPFYRIGSPSNYSSCAAPKRTSSLFIEISLRPGQQYNMNELVDQSLSALRKSGILRADDKILVRYPVVLPYAYVVYNRARKKTVERIQRYLNQRVVYSFGRYGSWIYSSMEDAILEGKKFSEIIRSLSSS